MELSWSTFVLEVVNFLVLVWILKRFLYKPVLEIIVRRREGIEKKIAAAERLREDAEGLKNDYEGRLAVWEIERRRSREELKREIDAERVRQLETLQKELARQREKALVSESRRKTKRKHEIEHRALVQGAGFASRLLGQAAGPELEMRLVALLLDGLKTLSETRKEALRSQWGEPPGTIRVVSAYPLADSQRQALEEALGQASGLEAAVCFDRDPGLMAGLSVEIGSWVLNANIRDDLKGFVEFAHAAS